MDKCITIAFAALFSFSNACKAQSNTYNMVIEMSNGTKINIGPNDVKNITFFEGDLSLSGGSLETILNTQKDMQSKLSKLEEQLDKNTKAISQLSTGSNAGAGANLTAEARKFVGFWRNKEKYQYEYRHFCFFPDGRCVTYGVDCWPCKDEGLWSYNETTNILATTCGNWQFQVTLFTDNEWAGISLGSNPVSSSFTRDNDCMASICISNTKWQCDTLNLSFGYNDGSFNFKFSCDDFAALQLESKLHFDSRTIYLTNVNVNGETIEANYKIEDAIFQYGRNDHKTYFYRTIDTGTLTVTNLYSPDAELVFSNRPTHVYKKKNEQ